MGLNFGKRSKNGQKMLKIEMSLSENSSKNFWSQPIFIFQNIDVMSPF